MDVKGKIAVVKNGMFEGMRVTIEDTVTNVLGWKCFMDIAFDQRPIVFDLAARKMSGELSPDQLNNVESLVYAHEIGSGIAHVFHTDELSFQE